MMRFSQSLLAAAVLAAAVVPNVQAQSVTISSSVPKNSAAETALKDKKLPVAVRFTPCTTNSADPVAGEKDQLAFSIKYDAGALATGGTAPVASTLKNVYLVLSSPSLAGSVYAIERKNLNVGATYNEIIITQKPNTGGALLSTLNPYVAASQNLGGSQTETVAGGSLNLEGMETGLWALTAIIADGTTAKIDDPSTWAAWDTTTFMVGGPWNDAGPAGALTCS